MAAADRNSDLRDILNRRRRPQLSSSSTSSSSLSKPDSSSTLTATATTTMIFEDKDLRQLPINRHFPRKRRRRFRRKPSPLRRRQEGQITRISRSRSPEIELENMLVLDGVDCDEDENEEDDELTLSSSDPEETKHSPLRLRKSSPQRLTDRKKSGSGGLNLSSSPERIIRHRGRRRPRNRRRSPRRRSRDRHRRRSRSRSLRKKRKDEKDDDWESKVEAFMNSLESKKSKEEEGVSKIAEEEPLLPPGVDNSDLAADELNEDLKCTPLVRFIGQKLSGTELKLEGVFQYNLLSLLSRSEWIGAKTIKLLEAAGYTESSLYSIATAQGGPALETELKTAIFTGKVSLGNKPQLVQQVLRVVEIVVKYFTSTGEEDEKDEEGKDNENGAKTAAEAKPVRTGMAEILKHLSEENKEEEQEAPEIPLDVGLQSIEEVNPWTRLWDGLQSENLRSFQDMKNFIAKDLLRLHGPAQSDAFDIAQEMVSCWVLAGFGLGSLQHMVMQTANAEDIIPPMSEATAAASQPVNKRYLYHDLLDRLRRLRNELPPKIDNEKLEYLVRKSLIYVMRGCDKMPIKQNSSTSSLSTNIVFNYLPPGLREAERKTTSTEDLDLYEIEEETVNNKQEEKKKKVLMNSSSNNESSDPLNAILNPGESTEKSNPNLLPNRKYNLGALHLEWVVIQGKPQIYELSIYMTADMSTLNLYVITPAMAKSPDTMENLGFVANPDRHEFYYVQVGIGCVKALTLEKTMEKMVTFLEEKRNTTSSENRNNGLVLITHSDEELSNFLQILEETGHNNLMLDTVKGFGTLENFIERNKSKKFSYGGPKLNLTGEEVFYHTEIRKGLTTLNLVSRAKAEAMFQALEHFLDTAPNYKSFISIYCFPSFSPVTEALKKKAKKVRELYTLEVFMAAQLKAQRTALFLEGVFQPTLGKDLREKSCVVANRIVQLLVNAGFDKTSLAQCYKRNSEFMINSNVILDKMNMAQRLKVMDQTMRCIQIIKNYFTDA